MNVGRPGETDENLNRKFGFSFVPRAQDYSTTSLEFSDVESLVSDSVGRRSDHDDEEQQGVWNQTESQGGPVAPPDELRLDREPVGFVEFTPVDENSDKNDAGNNTGHSRSFVVFFLYKNYIPFSGIRGLMRGVATLPKEPLVVKDNFGRRQASLG